MMYSNNNRIPRWLVENDPSWERSIVDSDLGILRWAKKGTQIQAVCPPTSMFCEIIGQTTTTNQASELPNLLGRAQIDMHAGPALGINDITKYLSSRYLNPGMNALPQLDLRKISRW